MKKHLLLIILLCSSAITGPLLCMEASSDEDPVTGLPEDKKDAPLSSGSSSSLSSKSKRHLSYPTYLIKAPYNFMLNGKILSDTEMKKFRTIVNNLMDNEAGLKTSKKDINFNPFIKALMATHENFFIDQLRKQNNKTIIFDEKNFINEIAKTIDDRKYNHETLAAIYTACNTYEPIRSPGYSGYKGMAYLNARTLKNDIESQQNIFKRNYKKLVVGFGVFCGALGIMARPYMEKFAHHIGSIAAPHMWNIASFLKDKLGR